MQFCTSLTAATLLLAAYAGPARALDEGMGLQHGDEISDQVLSGVRGRFLAPGRIVRFGVEMVSTWQTRNGSAYQAGATLDVALDGKAQVRFVPALTVTEPAAIAAASPAQTNVARGGAGLSSVSGVAQVIQVAGDGNQITNSATVTVTSTNPTGSALPSAPGPNQVSTVTSGGARLSAGISAQGMSVSIDIPAAGQALQQIKTSGAATGTGILQMAHSTADLQRVQNRMNVFVQLAPDAASRSVARDNALHTLRTMRGAGLY